MENPLDAVRRELNARCPGRSVCEARTQIVDWYTIGCLGRVRCDAQEAHSGEACVVILNATKDIVCRAVELPLLTLARVVIDFVMRAAPRCGFVHALQHVPSDQFPEPLVPMSFRSD
jgi:hypothetical protein